MRVCIFGTGYVGLVPGTCLAEVGHDVVCVDVDAAKVEGLNNGIVPIYEPGLTPMVKANHAAGRLRFTTDAGAGIAHGDVLFIAVGTEADAHGMRHEARDERCVVRQDAELAARRAHDQHADVILVDHFIR